MVFGREWVHENIAAMKKLFAIPSLIAAGLFPAQSVAVAALRLDEDNKGNSLFDVFKKNHAQVISAHRSHSSHSSHGSHRSSSGGGYGGYSAPRIYTPPPPTRNYDSTPPSSILPSSPSVAPKAAPADPAASRLAEKFKDTVRVVQLALQAYGYYTGAIDGVVGPDTSTAISKMQADYGLKVTGTVTPEVLGALKITID
jgi:His-Xaa-Ser repeat protein HxsA